MRTEKTRTIRYYVSLILRLPFQRVREKPWHWHKKKPKNRWIHFLACHSLSSMLISVRGTAIIEDTTPEAANLTAFRMRTQMFQDISRYNENSPRVPRSGKKKIFSAPEPPPIKRCCSVPKRYCDVQCELKRYDIVNERCLNTWKWALRRCSAPDLTRCRGILKHTVES